jgi:hypothetical protein
MLFLSIAYHYFAWHYSSAFREMFHVWKNLLWFVFRFFSIAQLLNSWFAPWKRITVDRGETWNLEDLAGFIVVGCISRIIGFVIRTAVICLGLTCLLITLIGGIGAYIFWIIAPAIIIGLVGLSVISFIQ